MMKSNVVTDSNKACKSQWSTVASDLYKRCNDKTHKPQHKDKWSAMASDLFIMCNQPTYNPQNYVSVRDVLISPKKQMSDFYYGCLCACAAGMLIISLVGFAANVA